MTLRQLKRTRWAVRGALTLGIAASVFANILHAEPNTIARGIAAWPPLALLLTIELMSRVPVHRRARGVVRLVAAGAIAGIAAWVSYWHMAGVAARYGESYDSAHLLPLSVDGLIVVSSVSLIELAGRIRDAGLPPAETPAEPVNSAAPGEPDAQVSEPEETPNSGNGHDPAKVRRAKALADLALKRDPVAVAAEAGVQLGTLQRWVDDAAKNARLPRGGRRIDGREGVGETTQELPRPGAIPPVDTN